MIVQLYVQSIDWLIETVGLCIGTQAIMLTVRVFIASSCSLEHDKVQIVR